MNFPSKNKKTSIDIFGRYRFDVNVGVGKVPNIYFFNIGTYQKKFLKKIIKIDVLIFGKIITL